MYVTLNTAAQPAPTDPGLLAPLPARPLPQRRHIERKRRIDVPNLKISPTLERMENRGTNSENQNLSPRFLALADRVGAKRSRALTVHPVVRGTAPDMNGNAEKGLDPYCSSSAAFLALRRRERRFLDARRRDERRFLAARLLGAAFFLDARRLDARLFGAAFFEALLFDARRFTGISTQLTSCGEKRTKNT